MRLDRLLPATWRLANRWESLWRGVCIRGLIILCGGRCGPGLRVAKGIHFKQPPHQGYRIGARVHFGRHITLDIGPEADLVLDDDVRFTGLNVLAAVQGITVGRDSIFGEGTCLRDADHGLSGDRPYRNQPMNAAAIRVENNVWVGRMVSILKGTTIRAHAVVAAHAVVRGEVEDRTLVGGLPARRIRHLDESRDR